MARNDWSELDLRTRSTMGPYDDELICLHLIPKLSTCTEQFMVGRMMTEEGKTWFVPGRGDAWNNGCWNISALKKRYRIEWTHLPPTDRKEVTSWAPLPL